MVRLMSFFIFFGGGCLASLDIHIIMEVLIILTVVLDSNSHCYLLIRWCSDSMYDCDSNFCRSVITLQWVLGMLKLNISLMMLHQNWKPNFSATQLMYILLEGNTYLPFSMTIHFYWDLWNSMLLHSQVRGLFMVFPCK